MRRIPTTGRATISLPCTIGGNLALYHLDLGEIDHVLALFDVPIYGARSRVTLDMIDASAILWRLHLRGVDVRHRWDALPMPGSRSPTPATTPSTTRTP